jgi:hypothetical protein
MSGWNNITGNFAVIKERRYCMKIKKASEKTA